MYFYSYLQMLEDYSNARQHLKKVQQAYDILFDRPSFVPPSPDFIGKRPLVFLGGSYVSALDIERKFQNERKDKIMQETMAREGRISQIKDELLPAIDNRLQEIEELQAAHEAAAQPKPEEESDGFNMPGEQTEEVKVQLEEINPEEVNRLLNERENLMEELKELMKIKKIAEQRDSMPPLKNGLKGPAKLRYSGSITFHPTNVRRALRSGRF